MKRSGKVSQSEQVQWSDGRADSDTHGTADHYLAWTVQGYRYRGIYQCNTFRAQATDVR